MGPERAGLEFRMVRRKNIEDSGLCLPLPEVDIGPPSPFVIECGKRARKRHR